MGATSEQDGDAFGREKPAHKVTLSSFMIGKYEVTQALWKAVMGSNPSEFKGDNLPVERVSWNDCQTFIKKLNSLTGKNFRLPTEAEWEYAARGGNNSQGHKYAGSDNIDDVAWYYGNSGDKTHAVGTKQPNELGLYDMSGNVWEWCSDRFEFYRSSAQTNPTGATSGSRRVYRGGSCGLAAGYCRVSFRDYDTPDYSYSRLGLRLSKEVNDVSLQKNEDNDVYSVVEEMPSFVGGQEAMLTFVSSKSQYLVTARINGIPDRVIIEFIVEKDGTISNAKVIKSVNPSLDERALRIVKSMPKWNPGKQNGKPVRVRFRMPVVF